MHCDMIGEARTEDRLAAVSPKSDQAFGSGGCDGGGTLLRPAISKQAETEKATQ